MHWISATEFFVAGDPTKEMQNKQVKENNAEQKTAMTKELSRRFHGKKGLKVGSSCGFIVFPSAVWS